jgi:F-type H+-transporting ATPase subunit epsilon
VSEQVDELQLPGADGYFGVLPDHAPLLARLQVGEMWYRIGQVRHYLAIAFGFAEVVHNRVIVLARIAERAQDIDVSRAEAAKRRAEERMAQPARDMDFERARVALMKSLVRLQVASRARTRA